MLHLDQEQAALIGLELRRIVPTEGFQKSVEVLRFEYSQMMISTSPDQKSLREEIYQTVQALDNLIATMNTFIAVAEQSLLDDTE